MSSRPADTLRGMNESKLRVLRAFEFQRPDRIPRFDTFWEYPDSWREYFGAESTLSDIYIRVPEEGTFPTRKKHLKRAGPWEYFCDGWGRVCRSKDGAAFLETISVPIAEPADVDAVRFDPAEIEWRYPLDSLVEQKQAYCVFGKTGGPFLRSTYVRGETQFLMDIAADPSLAKAIADKVADHLIGIGVQQLKSWDLYDTGIWIFDDMGDNRGPLFSPESFERVFLPAYKRMISAYKRAGAEYVVLHSDGNILPIADILVDAGIDGLNPLERKAGMDPEEIRRRYPSLILIGGMCNANVLPFGRKDEIISQTKRLIDLGRDGGFVIGAHSIGPDVSRENFEAYHRTCLSAGKYGGEEGRPGEIRRRKERVPW